VGAVIHIVTGHLAYLFCGSLYSPTKIYERPPALNDPEAKVLLDDTEEEIFVPPQPNLKKKGATSKKGKSDFETEEENSFFS